MRGNLRSVAANCLVVALAGILSACDSSSAGAAQSAVVTDQAAEATGRWQADAASLAALGGNGENIALEADFAPDGTFTMHADRRTSENGSTALIRRTMRGNWAREGERLIVSDYAVQHDLVEFDGPEQERRTLEELFRRKNERALPLPAIEFRIAALDAQVMTLVQRTERMTLRRAP